MPKVFIGFLLLNAVFLSVSYLNYTTNRYYQMVHSLTNAVLNLHYSSLPYESFKQKKSAYHHTWPSYIKYNLSAEPAFKNILNLNITELQKHYLSKTYREVRKRVEGMLSRKNNGRQKLSVCYSDLGFCVDFSISAINRIYLYLLLIVASLFIALIVPIYFTYTQKLLKPFLKLKLLAEKLGLKAKKHSLFTPFFMRDTANLMVQVTDKVEKMLNEKLQTLSALSHDLKTPLAKAKLYTQNVIPKTFHKELITYYSDMEYLIEQINVYSSRSYHIEKQQKVNLVEFVDSICYEYQVNNFKIDFHSSLTCIVLVLQRKSFKRVIQNLIDNAIKYAHGVSITILLLEAEQSLCLRFEDDGPGVDPNLIEKLCEPFFRMDQARSHNLPGSGLGLSIVKDIVEHNGATLTIYNKSAGGSGLVVDIKWSLTSKNTQVIFS
ncbi:sensor histidine kinase [Facilibium subflavum]|uniref:sensor histidine kinase n=1 Tax=Facilibium subflavum TaxID=2219058 RepID=UPI0013C31EB4|nr:HAMP domain-containing sensor histidine kinase [Facilibium subflavum]